MPCLLVCRFEDNSWLVGAPVGMQSKGRRVTVVDDDNGMRSALGQLLAAAGFEAVTFSSAEEFLGDTTSPKAACLILDVHLPGLSGFDLCEQLHLSSNEPPVIFITAHDDPATRARAARLGAAAYLPKPFAGRRLLDELSRLTPRE